MHLLYYELFLEDVGVCDDVGALPSLEAGEGGIGMLL